MLGSEQQDISRLLAVDDTPAMHEDIRNILALNTDQAALATMEAELFGDAAA